MVAHANDKNESSGTSEKSVVVDTDNGHAESDTATSDTNVTAMPSSTGKRRSVAAASSLPQKPHSLPVPAVAPSPASDSLLKAVCSPMEDPRSHVTRRRRFLVYCMIFTALLGLSSIMDVRRASLRRRNSKLQLTLPSSTSLTSLSDGSHGSPSQHGFAPLPNPAHAVVPPFGTQPVVPPSIPEPQMSQPQPVAVPVPPETKTETQAADVNISQQELDDDVHQLIAHVDQESQASSTTSAPANTTAPITQDPPPAEPGNSVEAVYQPPPEAPPAANNTTDTIRLNMEDQFRTAQTRLYELRHNESAKHLLDDIDLLTLDALSLQATRGNCEQNAGTVGETLFKTDAEVSSNFDIERTDPVWGAWCLFLGSYKTDAMRDFVTKQLVVEKKVATKLEAPEQANEKDSNPQFDPNAAFLDDVMTPEQQSALRSQIETIKTHLRESDSRYLSALSLQATFGDCGPYGREVVPESTEGEEPVVLRRLSEPLMSHEVTRKEGALWGAWCVMQGQKRATAASELSRRVELLIQQLTTNLAASEAAPASATESSTQAQAPVPDSATKPQ